VEQFTLANYFALMAKDNNRLLNKVWSIIKDIHQFTKEEKKTSVTLKVDLTKDVFFKNNEYEILSYLSKLGFDINTSNERNILYVQISWRYIQDKEIDQYSNILIVYQQTLQKQIYRTITPLSYTENLDNHYKIELDVKDNLEMICDMIHNERTQFEEYIRNDVVKCLHQYIKTGNVFIKIKKRVQGGLFSKKEIVGIFVKIDIYPFGKSVRMLTNELQQQESTLSKLKRALSLK